MRYKILAAALDRAGAHATYRMLEERQEATRDEHPPWRFPDTVDWVAVAIWPVPVVLSGIVNSNDRLYDFVNKGLGE